MKITQTIRISDGIEVNDLEYHEQGPYAGYITGFTVLHWKYVRHTVFRVHDPRDTSDMKLVQIEYSHLHPILRRHWQRIEQGLIDICERCGLSPASILERRSEK